MPSYAPQPTIKGIKLMIEKIFHVTLPQNAVAEREALLASIRRHHPTWEIMVWQDPLSEADFILGKYFSKCNSGAQLADLVRLDVLYRFGGVYIDSDVNILRSFDPLSENYSFFIASEDGIVLTNAIVGAKKGHPALDAMINHLLEQEPDWKLPPNVTTGPEFYAQILGHRNDISILPREAFYPYKWNEPRRLPSHVAYAEHCWAGSWVSPKAKEELRVGRKKGAPFSVKSNLRGLIKASFRTLRRLQRIATSDRDFLDQTSKYYSCSPEIVVQTSHGFRMFVNGFDISVSPDLILNGTYEPNEERFVSGILAGGDLFVDIGANFGIFTLLAAQQIGRFGRVIAFEPNENVANLLVKSLVMNWWQERVRTTAICRCGSCGCGQFDFV